MSDKYDIDKWLKICNTTLTNYINMQKRLTENKKLSDFVLVYYSVFFIINSLTALYFDSYNTKLCEYFGIILSVVMLTFSLINSNANYSYRIDAITNAINKLKTLKRDGIIDEDITEFKTRYNKIVDAVEFRNDLDFFRTIKSKCKELGVEWYKQFDTTDDEDKTQLKKYLSEVSPFFLETKIIVFWCFKILVILFPIVVISFCFIIKP